MSTITTSVKQREALLVNILGGKAQGTSAIAASVETIQVLAVDDSMWPDEAQRKQVRAGLMFFLYQRHPIGGTSHATAWLLSLLIAAFPQMYNVLNKAHNGVLIERRFLTKEDGDGLRGLRSYQVTTVVTPAVPASAGNPAVPAVTTTSTQVGAVGFRLGDTYGLFFSDEDVPEPDVELSSWWELVGALGIVLFGLAKPPTPKNYSAFVTQRPKNIANTAGAVITPEGVLTATLFPPAEALAAVRGGLNLRPRLRKALVAELITWTVMAISPDTELVAVSLRLWAGSAMGHVDLIRNFIINYGDYLVQIPGLLGETQKFIIEYSQLVNSKAADFAYIGVSEGSQRDKLRAKDYIQLTALARDVTSRTVSTWSAYASNLPPSTFIPMLEEVMAVSGKSLPPVSGTSATTT